MELHETLSFLTFLGVKHLTIGEISQIRDEIWAKMTDITSFVGKICEICATRALIETPWDVIRDLELRFPCSHILSPIASLLEYLDYFFVINFGILERISPMMWQNFLYFTKNKYLISHNLPNNPTIVIYFWQFCDIRIFLQILNWIPRENPLIPPSPPPRNSQTCVL